MQGSPRTPLELCRHYGLPLTKILATLLNIILSEFELLKNLFFSKSKYMTFRQLFYEGDDIENLIN